MLFWTVVVFITYSLVYFVVSQLKIRKLQKENYELSLHVPEKAASLQKMPKKYRSLAN